MTTSKEARGSATPMVCAPMRGLLTNEQRKTLLAALDKEFWQRVRAQCSRRTWPGRLRAWDVSPEGRVLAGVESPLGLTWHDAGAAPEADTQDPRLLALQDDRRAREAQWQRDRRSGVAVRRR